MELVEAVLPPAPGLETIFASTWPMNKVERVRAALAGEPVDRVPASFWLHFPDEVKRGEASVRAHMQYLADTEVDFLKIFNEHPYQANVSITAPGDWKDVRPAPLSSPFFQGQLDEVKAIVDEVGGACLTVTTVFGPFGEGNHATGHLVTEHLREDPESVSQGLAAIAESLAEFSLALLEAGTDGIYYSAQGGERTRFSEDGFLAHIKPHDLTVLKAIDGRAEFNLLHICKDDVRLEHYLDYPATAVNWAAAKNNWSLQEGLQRFQRPVMGGLHDRGLIVEGQPAEIETAVHQLLTTVGTQHFMVGADCTLPTDNDRNRIRAAVRATGTFQSAP